MNYRESPRRRERDRLYRELSSRLGVEFDDFSCPGSMPRIMDGGRLLINLGIKTIKFDMDKETYWGWDLDRKGRFKLTETQKGDSESVSYKRRHLIDLHTHPYSKGEILTEADLARHLVPTTHLADINDLLIDGRCLAYSVLAGSELDDYYYLMVVVKTRGYTPLSNGELDSLFEIEEDDEFGANFRIWDDFYTSRGFAIYRTHFVNDQDFPIVLRKYERDLYFPAAAR